jgi:hypothetical protein
VLASGHHTEHQSPQFHIQVDEREADLQPIEVFGDAAVSDFAEPEDTYENAEGMLHIVSHARLGHAAVAASKPSYTSKLNQWHILH